MATLDTLAYASALERAGMERSHSRALAEAARDCLMPDLATHRDVEALKMTLTIRMGIMHATSFGIVTALTTIATTLL